MTNTNTYQAYQDFFRFLLKVANAEESGSGLWYADVSKDESHLFHSCRALGFVVLDRQDGEDFVTLTHDGSLVLKARHYWLARHPK